MAASLAVRRCGALAVALLLAGCSAWVETGAERGARVPAAPVLWVRDVVPFGVLDPAGVSYEMPFLGGFNVPRPQLADIDGDGDLDLFVQERSGELLFFEREGSPGEIKYRWRPGVFPELEIGEWYRFSDVDADGDLDLFAEERFSHVRLYRNVGGPREPAFRLAADTLRDDRGEPIFSDRQNIPNAADIDCDGRIDLLIGRLIGTISRYEVAEEALGAAGAGLPGFQLVTDRFENIEIVGNPETAPVAPRATDPVAPVGAGPAPLPPGGPWARHGANTMALSDVDEDGDLDLFWGDFFEAGLLFIENLGTCAAANLRAEPVPFPLQDPVQTSGYNAPTFGDVDGDGDLDLLMGVLGGAFNPNTSTVENLLYLTQGDEGRFQVETRTFLSQIDTGSESIPVLLDVDGDGDLDLLVGNRVDPRGAHGIPDLSPRECGSGPPPLPSACANRSLSAAAFTAPPHSAIWMGTATRTSSSGAGTRSFSTSRTSDRRRARASRSWTRQSPASRGGAMRFPHSATSMRTAIWTSLSGRQAVPSTTSRTRGTVTSPASNFAARRTSRSMSAAGASPFLRDIDGDGDLDLSIGTETAGIVYYENRGSASAASFAEARSPFPAPTDLPALSAPAMGDLDGDGREELIVGGVGGGLHYYRQP